MRTSLSSEYIMRTRHEKRVSRLPAGTEGYAVGKTDSVQGFQALYQDYLGLIYRYAYSRIRNQEDAEDIASHVFLKVAMPFVRHVCPSTHGVDAPSSSRLAIR